MPARRRRPAIAVVVAVLSLLAAGWLTLETLRLAQAAGEAEVDARTARAEASAAQEQRVAAVAESARERERAERNEIAVLRLEGEVQAANQRTQALAEALDRRTAEEAAERERREAERALAAMPMPEGVRHCLAALHACLLADGFDAFRFVHASALDGEGLHDVELIVTDPDGLGTAVYAAQRLTVELDRGEAKATLRLTGGTQSANGVVSRLPPDGLPFVVRPVSTGTWEQRLPYLVTATGAEPSSAVVEQPADELEPSQKSKWLERLDGLLAGAGTQQKLRVLSFRKLTDARFVDAHLRGYDEKKHLALTADCKDLAVEIDERAGVVSLVLRDGSLRQAGGRSTISTEGYRMLLPNVTPDAARTAMLGMVVKR